MWQLAAHSAATTYRNSNKWTAKWRNQSAAHFKFKQAFIAEVNNHLLQKFESSSRHDYVRFYNNVYITFRN